MIQEFSKNKINNKTNMKVNEKKVQPVKDYDSTNSLDNSLLN